jgi:alkanesulfonate monooxygenase SsuD/methylene tetrahydromethanopterin reductase-like flavin-dependent oxidoreductase (luciferase family)
METGLFLDLRNPPAWERPWAQFYGSTLERLEEAERLGLESVWLSEHHLFEDGYLPQPLTFAAAVAVRTTTMRIGTAIVQAPLRPPADIAEQAAMVDILSGGRLELGLGAGYCIPEWELFGFGGKGRFEALENCIREIRRLWDEGITTPPPIQERPPIWVGGEGPRAARMAGRLGEGLLALKPELLEPYQTSLRGHGHDEGLARMAGCANLILADDPAAAWPRIAPHLQYQWQSYEQHAVLGRTRAASVVTAEGLRVRQGPPLLPGFDVVTPDEALLRIIPWLSALPATHVYFWGTIAGMPDELADRHVQLLAEHVVPALAGL